MNCKDCRWLDEPHGRDGASCRDQGNGDDSEACDTFAALDPEVSRAFTERKIGALTQQSYQAAFHEIMAEKFVLEQDLVLAETSIQMQLQSQGANVRADLQPMLRTANWLIDIYGTYRLSCAVGLGRFADDIINREIERYLAVKP